MPIVQDKYFIEDGMNEVFTELFDIEIEARPTKTGFLHKRYCTRKRDWLYTPDDWSWETDWDIKWGVYDDGDIYCYDDTWELYEFDWWILTQISTTGQTYNGTDYVRQTVKVDYLWWAKTGEFNVSAYNAWTSTITTTETTLTTDMIGKFVYMTTGTGIRQWSEIIQRPTTSTLVINWSFPTPITAWNKFVIYDERWNQILFPQVRETANLENITARDEWWNFHYWNFPNARKIVLHDNRLVQLHKNQNSILVSDPANLELIDVSKLVNLNGKALNITSYSWYIFVFFQNKIWVLVKNILDTADPDNQFLYVYQDKLNFWLFSTDAFYNDWVNLYVFGNDRRFYAVDISISNSWDVRISAESQWRELASYFNQITSWDVSFNYNANKLRMVHTISWLTQVYLFNQDVSWWYIHRYNWFDNNFMYFFDQIGVDLFTCFDNSIYRIWWLTDNWTNIEMRITFEWPVNLLGEWVELNWITFRLGFDGNKIWGKVRTRIWGNKLFITEADISQLTVVDDINTLVDWWTFGSILVGDYLRWWSPSEWDITNVYNEYIDCKLWLHKMGTHYEIQIINNEDTQLYFSFAIPEYNQTHPTRLAMNNSFS